MNGSTILGGPVMDAYRFIIDGDTAVADRLEVAATDTTSGKSCSEPRNCKAKPAVKKAPAKKAPVKKKADAGWIPVQQGWSAPPPSLHV